MQVLSVLGGFRAAGLRAEARSGQKEREEGCKGSGRQQHLREAVCDAFLQTRSRIAEFCNMRVSAA